MRKLPRAVIGPNANAMFRNLAKTAAEIGMSQLAELLELAFRDDIRNAIFHADYILAPDGLRLRRRNGGFPSVISHEETKSALQIALYFFALLDDHQQALVESFRPARTIIGRFSANLPMPWRIEWTEDGRLSISSDAPAPKIDDAYERQRQINDHLGGKVFVAYVAPNVPASPELISHIASVGFDVSIVDLVTEARFDALLEEVIEQGLWDAACAVEGALGAVLMANPMGFRWISTTADFENWLPMVEDIEVASAEGRSA